LILLELNAFLGPWNADRF